MIRFGPSGIPLSCKGRTPRDGIEDVHNLGLNAIELQFVRVNVEERYAHEHEFGKKRREVEGQIIVDVLRNQEPIAPTRKPVKPKAGKKGKAEPAPEPEPEPMGPNSCRSPTSRRRSSPATS